MLSIAICEDNLIHAQKLHNMIEPLLEMPHKITTYTTGQDLWSALNSGAEFFELIFMDIELESDSITGIQLAHKINLKSPTVQIIYISQYLEYASSVYETKHIYFVNKKQLDIYLEKALYTALENLRTIENQTLHFKRHKIQYSIPQSEILYMERILRNTEIHTNKELFSTSDSLKTLMLQLSPAFVLCHRSFIVNLKTVSSFNREKITLHTGHTLPVGRTHYSDIQKSFAKVILEQV